MVTRRQVLGAGAAAAAGGLLGATPARADYRTRVDPDVFHGTWQGWGASLSWWANVFGMSDDLARIFFSTETVSYPSEPKPGDPDPHDLPGLGLTAVRYNLGASGPGMRVSPDFAAYKQIPAYWRNWFSDDPGSDSWDWNVDSGQRNMLWKARDLGATRFEMFSASPVWWMCRNHDPCGAADGGDNLQSWNYRQHARYVATVAKYAHDHWGVDFGSVEPFNEPSADFWRSPPGRQEGCHISATPDNRVQQRVVNYLREELDGRGLTGTVIAASDENTYTEATRTWRNLDAFGARDHVGRVNVHGYQYGDGGGARKALFDAVAGARPIWQSEYGEQYEHGLYLAYNIAEDMRHLHPVSWFYWQPVDGSVHDPDNGRDESWGLLKATYSLSTTDKGGHLAVETPYPGTDEYVANKYYVMAQYSRHIRPGMRIIDSGDQATVAAYDPGEQKLVLVTVRGDTSQNVTYDLSAFAAVGATAKRRVTDADPYYRIARQYEKAPDVAVDTAGKRLTVLFGANSVQTIEIDGVRTA